MRHACWLCICAVVQLPGCAESAKVDEAPADSPPRTAVWFAARDFAALVPGRSMATDAAQALKTPVVSSLGLTLLTEVAWSREQTATVVLTDPAGVVRAKIRVRTRIENVGFVDWRVAEVHAEFVGKVSALAQPGMHQQMIALLDDLRRPQTNPQARAAHRLAHVGLLRAVQALPGVPTPDAELQHATEVLEQVPADGTIELAVIPEQAYRVRFIARQRMVQ